jgi:branched-chain amino acid transport system permease protein
MDIYQLSLMTIVCINIILALGLNLITGYCGQISLGHAAFFGIGAYTVALTAHAGLPAPICLLGAIGLAGTIGIVVGMASLRVRDDFLAITTMGVGFLFLGIVRQQESLLGGEMGLSGIPTIGLGKPGFLVMVIVVAALCCVLSLYIKRSWMGFAFEAVATDEDTAQLLTVDVAAYKLTAFALGTAMAGLAGGLYCYFTRFIMPDDFGFLTSISVLSMVAVGGIGSVPGVIIGTALLTLLPEMSTFLSDYKLLFYGAMLFGVMRFAPEGIAGIGLALRRRMMDRGGAK